MGSVKKAESILLNNLNKRFPSLRYILADLIEGKRVCDICKKYDVKEQSIRNLKSRYKKELEGLVSNEE